MRRKHSRNHGIVFNVVDVSNDYSYNYDLDGDKLQASAEPYEGE